MHNFVFDLPTKIIFGSNRIEELGKETAVLGKHVLLVTGQHSLKVSGFHTQIYASLENAGCEITEFSGVTANPCLSQVHAGIECFRENNCDIVCAAGGGSVIDAAKAICCGVPVQHDVWKFFTTKKKLQTTIPLTTFPTLAASGTENSGGLVITNDTLQLKFGYGNRLAAPRVSLLDPQATCSASPTQTGYGSADIISHLVEFSCSNALDSGMLSFEIMAAIIRSVATNCSLARQQGDHYQARAELMWAAALSLSGLCSAGLGRIGFPAHLIEHGLSVFTNGAHGAEMAVILPLWMRYIISCDEAICQKIAQLGKRLFLIDQSSTKSMALHTVQRLQEMFSAMGCPSSLTELGVTPDMYHDIADNCQALARVWRLREYSPERIHTILQG